MKTTAEVVKSPVPIDSLTSASFGPISSNDFVTATISVSDLNSPGISIQFFPQVNLILIDEVSLNPIPLMTTCVPPES